MHELSLLESVREIIEQQASVQKFTQVTSVTLDIGALSSVEPEALRFGFDIVMQGSIAEQAELVIELSPGKGICEKCRQQVSLMALYQPCPLCEHFAVKVTHGTEMKIKTLSVI